MSTSTMMRLVGWRVRDWATCFSACALPPLDEEPGTDHSTKLAARAMVFDPLGETRSREIHRRNSRRKKHEQEKEIVECPMENFISIEAEEDGRNDKRWPSFADEEYIVFCFRDDGAIHMIKERKPSEASDNQTELPSRNLSPANQKVCCKHHHGHSNHVHVEEKSIASTNEEDAKSMDKIGSEKEDNDVEVVWPPDEIKEINHIESANDNMGESGDSNRSDSSSTGSFAFPVLGWEWMGSPVQMPKPQGMRLGKHRPRAARLHCCRF